MSVRRVLVRRDDVRAGESWFAAARRRAGVDDSGPVQPWVVDLSGDPLVFALGAPASTVSSVGFRALGRDDFPALLGLLTQPHVRRWWNDREQTVDDLEAHYGPAIDGRDPTRLWMVDADARPVGFVQDYRVGDHADWALLTARPDAVGIDYLVGDPALVGHGFGARMLGEYLRTVVTPAYDATEVFSSPDHRNAASLRVLAKLGFEKGLWFDEPQPDGRTDTLVGCTLDIRRVIG